MTIKNSKLVDPERMVVSVLDRVLIQLFAGYLWHADDIDELTAKGSEFHAFE